MLRLMLLSVLLVAGVAEAKDISIYQRTDKFRGTTVYYTASEQPRLEGGSFFSMRYVYMNFLAVTPMADASTAYSLKIDANLQDWMFINDGESLILKVDGETVPLRGPGSADDRELDPTGGISETAYYAFSLDTLRKLAAAQAIEFRVYGSKGTLTGAFTEPMLQELRYFAQEAPGMISDPGAKISAAPASAAMPTPGPAQTTSVVPPKPSIQQQPPAQAVDAVLPMSADKAFQKAAKVLVGLNAIPASSDRSSGTIRSDAIPVHLDTAKADCGKMFGIPYLKDKRVKTNATYQVNLAAIDDATSKVSVGVVLDGYMDLNEGGLFIDKSVEHKKPLTCSSKGWLEAQFIDAMRSQPN